MSLQGQYFSSMGQLSTLQRIVTAQLRVHGLELSDLLSAYPHRSFTDIRTEIVNRTGITLSSRTVRRWFNDTNSRPNESSVAS